MKHIFIINPAAGKGDIQKDLGDKICAAAEKTDEECEIYTTKCVRDAEALAAQICKENMYGRLRFYACGGDGTLGEIANGVYGRPKTELAVIPMGTGNDFSRNFANPEAFLDIEAQIAGEAIDIDALLCNGRYSVNFINMGFDCSVVERVAKIKRFPFIPLKLAYIAGVVTELVRMPGIKIKRLALDGTEIEDRKLLLCAAANGGFCGGGFNSAPKAKLDDGVMDVCVAKTMSRTGFVSMVGGYKNGTYIDDERTMKKVSYHKCRTLDIDFEGETSVCFDGEIEKCKSLHIEVVPDVFRFSVPRGAFYDVTVKKKKKTGAHR